MAARCPAPVPMWASDAMRLALALCAAFTLPAAAETPMTGAEFQAHVGTNTFSYAYSNGVRGTADYGPGRTLLWAFEGGDCFTGTWFEDGDQLCFAFEDGRLSACWHFFKDNGRLRGTATYLASGDTADIEIFEVSHSDQPLGCPGPDVGV
jgi:hypothetical protein